MRNLTSSRNGSNHSSEPISQEAVTKLIKPLNFPPVRPTSLPLHTTNSYSRHDIMIGPINLTPDDPAPHSMEPQFRKLGMTTSLIRGVPTLGAPHVVCTKGDVLNANQVQLLKLFHKTYATVSPFSLSPPSSFIFLDCARGSTDKMLTTVSNYPETVRQIGRRGDHSRYRQQGIEFASYHREIGS